MSDRHGQETRPTFRSLGVAIEICQALEDAGMPTAFAIQELTLPIALAGQDLTGQARTGMGKTLGFGVPLLDRVFDDANVSELDGSVRALVVVPTRELCVQVTEDLQLAARNLSIPADRLDLSPARQPRDGQYPITVTSIYGGVPFEPQIQTLRDGCDVVVGTPGRLIDLNKRGELDLSTVEIVVLDEADEMLDQGFLDDIQYILKRTSPDRQTMLFSATMPGPIMALSRTFMKRPVLIQTDDSATAATHEQVRQIVFQSHWMDRMSALSRILQTPKRGRTIIFTPTKRRTARVAEDLAKLGFNVGAVHGDMRQPERERSLELFRTKSVDIMVATDVAARGIDVTDVTHVINFQVPENHRTYVHRIGRTARAGKSGTAITLLDFDELPRWKAIDSELGLDLAEPPQWFSSTPEFLDTFDLPPNPAALSDQVGEPRKVRGSSAATAPARYRTRLYRGAPRGRGGRG